MRRIILFTLLFILYVPLHSQQRYCDQKAAITVGVLNGGGGLVGADLELLINDKFGVQGGIGFVSYGFGLNYHLKDGCIRSSYINLAYMHQGLGESYYQSIIGPSFVYRYRKLLQAQLGLGVLAEEGPAYDGKGVPLLLLYSIGLYFPFN